MKIGDKGFAVLSADQMYRIEEVTILEEKEGTDLKRNKIKYWKVNHEETCGVSGIPKERVFKTREEAEFYRNNLIEKEHQEFVSKIHDKKSFFKYFYDLATCQSYNIYNDKYIADKIKEYAGVDVLQEEEKDE